MKLQIRVGPSLFTVAVGMALSAVSRGAEPPATFALRVIANPVDHKPVIKRASAALANKVVEGDQIVAEWLPFWPGGPAEKELRGNKEVVLREKPHTFEVLVICGKDDISQDDTTYKEHYEDVQGYHNVVIQLTEKGMDAVGRLTTANLPDPRTGFHRRVAMIVNEM